MSLIDKWDQMQKTESEPHAQNTQNTQNRSFANIADIAHKPPRVKMSSREAFHKLLDRLELLPDTTLEILTYDPIPTFTLSGDYDGTAYKLFLMAVDAIHEHALHVARMRQ